ncbi:hypothetical protein Pelo_463 [Pelomyxa schiedti]|nr:hypothetical protein Pelo_463 [Pelomyxa schiedti]
MRLWDSDTQWRSVTASSPTAVETLLVRKWPKMRSTSFSGLMSAGGSSNHGGAGRRSRPAEEVEHVLSVSSVVWNHVLPQVYWPGPHNELQDARDAEPDVEVSLVRLATALFPLLCLACAKLAHEGYCVAYAAGVAGSPGAMRWACSPAARRCRQRYPPWAPTAAIAATCPADTAVTLSVGVATAASAAATSGITTTCSSSCTASTTPITTTSSSSSSAGDIDEETAARIARGKRTKLCFMLLSGLCVGGHVGLARKLVSNQIMGVWWPLPEDPESAILDEYISDSAILSKVAELKDLETVKWLVERFGFHEPWEFAQAVSGACDVGNLALLEWLDETFNLHSELKIDSSRHLLKNACASGHLPCVKWVMEKFPVSGEELRDFDLLLYTLQPSHDGATTSSHIEVACWLKENLGITDLDFETQKKVVSHCELEMVKQIFALVGINSPSEELLKPILKRGDLSRAKWLVEDNNRQPNPEHFILACRNRKANSCALAEWVYSKLTQPLSLTQIALALANALAIGNTSLSDWLNDTFQVINQIQSSATLVSQELEDICRNLSRTVKEGVGILGVKWFLTKINKESVALESILRACFSALKVGDLDIALVLLGEFHISPEENAKLYLKLLKVVMRTGNRRSVFKILAMKDFSQEDVAHCLACRYANNSSEMVKYLIERFHLGRDHITQKKNNLLCCLLAGQKLHCAQWLTAKFHLDSDNVLEMDIATNIDYWDCEGPFIPLWRWIIEAFPTIGPEQVQKLLPLVVLSPKCTQKVIQHYGLPISMDVIERHCAESFALFFSRQMTAWLQHHCGNIWVEKLKSSTYTLEEGTYY